MTEFDECFVGVTMICDRELWKRWKASEGFPPFPQQCSCCRNKRIANEERLWYCIVGENRDYAWLIANDKISHEKRSLRALIKEMEDEVLASAGVDSFEEIFRLIFAKL
ncbi:MAG: hypothetical protein IJH64_12235 [Oscillospiraceae bacterium]|nr:hypothetical protein [Oscillospiraceae bacterium]